MKINIAAIGKIKTNSEENNLIKSYLKRTPWETEIKELEEKRKLETDQLKQKEGELLLNEIKSGYVIVALDERGKHITSQEFAEHIVKWRDNSGGRIAFILGGANGHSEEVRQKADFVLSLGKMTLPHMLARVVLIEQLYRAYTIINNHPYHK
jgi:23S rRNA (pseudouridine1915-N3)-methyltransferase